MSNCGNIPQQAVRKGLMTVLKEGTTNVPQQAFEQWNDPYGTKLIAINRDGSILCQGITFADGTSMETAAIVGLTSAVDEGTF